MNEQAVFLAALDIVDPAERAAYVKRTCAGDPTLLRHVEALLAAHERSGEFLDVPALRQITAGASEDRPSLDETLMECSDIKEEVDLSFLLPSTQPGSLGRLGHYEVQEVIGRGGCGVVLKAFDDILHRLVAIKVMTPEMAATSPARKRFLREARAAASIRHENVVSIHAVEEKPIPFLVMEYIAGQTLQQKLDQNGPLDVEEVVQIGQQIASGLEAAHAIGLIHRDIKPGNILLDKGRDRIKITDFGLARATDDASITQSGVIAGTPLYMSPEQAHGAAIDHRSDLFSLGSVLYVMCSGRPPFRAATTLAVLKRVAEDEPRPIQEIIPEVPEWLIAIISRLLAKKPADRFTSAQEVSNLLARFLSEMQHRGRVESLGDVLPMMPKPAIEVREPVPVANPITPEPRMPAPEKRPVHSRNRRWAMAAALFLTVLAGIGMTEATGVTNVRGTVIRLFSPDGTLVVEVDDPGVSVSIDGADMVITGAGAKEIRLKPGQYKLLARKDGEVIRQELVTVTTNGRRVVRVSKEAGAAGGNAVDPRVEAPAASDRWVQLIKEPPPPAAALLALRRDQIFAPALAFAGDGDPRKAPTTLVAVLGEPEPIHSRNVTALAFSADGRWMVSANGDRTILVWDAATMKVRRVLRGHTNTVTSAAFTPDGKTIVSGSADGTIKLWSRDTEGEPTTIRPGMGPLQTAVSSDGRFLAAGAGGNATSVKLWKWGQWQAPVELPVQNQGDAMTLAFSPDGEMLACGYGFMTESPIDLFNTADGKLKQSLPSLNGAVNSLSFSRDGKSLASTGPSPGKLTSKARIWNLASGKAVDMGAPGYRVCLSPDGKTLAVGSWKHVEIYDVESQKLVEGIEALSCAGHAWSLAFSPDGKTLVVGDDGGAVNFYDTASWQPKKGFLESSHRGAVMGLAVHPNGRTILSIGVDRTLRLWDLDSPGNSQIVYRGNRQFLGGLACSPDGTSFTVADDEFVIWDAGTLKEKHRFAAMIGPVVYSPDGRTLAGQQRYPDMIRIWDVTQGKAVHTFPALKELASDLAFSADGRRLAVAGVSGKVVVWDVVTGNEVASWKETQIRSVAFHPDGRSLATGFTDGTINFLDTSTWLKCRTLYAHTGPVVSLKFTPDGKTLLSSSVDGTVQARSPEHDRALVKISVGLADSPIRFDLDPSGQYLFATGPTPAIYVHRLPGNDGGPQAGQVTAEQRKALEWVLSAGGTIYLQSGGKLLNFHQGDRLPDDPFKTVQVFLQDIDASSAVDDVSIENLKALPNFDLLKLVSSRVSDVGLARLATYPWFANLDHLGLNDTPLSDAGLAHVKNCKRLNWLTLSNVPVTGGGLAHLRGLPLSTLWIQGCRRVGDDAADILADIPTLTGLDLQGTAITPAGIAKLSRLPGLQSLFVSGDAVTDDLAAVARLQGLTGLRIDSLTVTDAGLARLTTLPELKHLIFTESKAVTDAAVDHIAKCKNLRTFNVKRCGITQAGVKKLAALRPDLKIEWDGGVIEPAPASSVIGQHKALQWVLEDRGSRHTSYLTLKAKEKVMHLMTGNEVPDGPVEVIQVSLSGLQQADSRTAIENLTRLFSPDFRFHNSPGIEDEVLAALANHPNTKNVTNFHMNTIGVTASGFAHIRKFSNLRTLGVGLAPVSARELAQLRELPLTSLTVFACKEVNDDAIAEVATYPALKTLALAGLPLTDRSLEHLAKCKTLGLLTFARMTFSEAARKKLIAALPGCKITWDGTVEPTVAADPDRRAAEYVLSMGGGVTIQSAGRDQSVQNAGELPSGAFQLTAAGWARVNDQVDDAGLAHFEGCKNLTSIIVLSRRVTDNGMVYFKDCKKLSTLWLLGTQVTDAGLVHFKDCKELAKLHLAGSSGITDAGLAYFKDLKLQGLHLDETKVSDAGLAILVDPESLESLGLGNTRVSGAGLAFLKDCRNLSNLDLRKTKVTDAEMSHFKDCQKLTNIVLNDTEVGDSGLAHLRDCKVIRTLHLQGTPLTDVGVDTLKGFPQLTHVWLNRTKATAAGIAGLQKALPGCRIHWDGGVIEPTGSTSGKQ